MKKKKAHSIFLDIKVKNPREHAPQYKIRTIQELFDVLTLENLPRFIKDFEAGMTVIVGTKEIMQAIAEEKGEKAEQIKMTEFVWTDDRQDEKEDD